MHDALFEFWLQGLKPIVQFRKTCFHWSSTMHYACGFQQVMSGKRRCGVSVCSFRSARRAYE